MGFVDGGRGGVPLNSDRVAALSPNQRRKLSDMLRGRAEAQGSSKLVAYYATHQGLPLSADEIRSFLGERLPDFMVPHSFEHLESLPRTVHGKIDREALHAPGAQADLDPDGFEEPASELELAVTEIWARVLGIEMIGRHDSFFEIGGDSLLGIRLLGQIREQWEIDLSMEALFDHPTVAATAAHIEAVRWARSSGESSDSSEDNEEVEF